VTGYLLLREIRKLNADTPAVLLTIGVPLAVPLALDDINVLVRDKVELLPTELVELVDTLVRDHQRGPKP